jgi:hypothetical protein
MKFCLISLLLFSGICKGQVWKAEFMAGVSGYNGDLTQQRVSIKQLRPAFNLNLKYNSGDLFNFRVGIGYGRVGADDKNNTSASLRSRNLNFKSDIIELNLIGEVNLFDPQVYTDYPYVFGGIGVFHFNPFTYDKNNKKTYLQPLSTEGEGLKEYPGRKKYKLTQVCIPIGVGFKWMIKEKWDISYEFGYRILFTDYLDDVSTTYVDLNILAAEKGTKAAELSYRGTTPFNNAGAQRGNPSIKDSYFFSGIKIGTSLSNLFNRE